MPRYSKKEVKSKINRIVGKSAKADIIRFCKAKKPKLWESVQEDDFLENNVYLSVFKHVENIGYKPLAKGTLLSN